MNPLARRSRVIAGCLLGLVVAGWVLGAIRGAHHYAAPAHATAARPRAVRDAARPPVPAAMARAQAGATAAVARFDGALRNGDVEQLCRPNGIFTGAVVADLNLGGVSCEAAFEDSPVLARPPALTVTGATARPDLITARVRVGAGQTLPLDVVRDGGRWLVSFSNDVDPLTALEQH